MQIDEENPWVPHLATLNRASMNQMHDQRGRTEPRVNNFDQFNYHASPFFRIMKSQALPQTPPLLANRASHEASAYFQASA
jgi:hypothetical protein